MSTPVHVFTPPSLFTIRLHQAASSPGCVFTRLCLHQAASSPGCVFTRLRLHQAASSPGCVFTRLRLHQAASSPGCVFTRLRLHQAASSPGCVFTRLRLHRLRLHHAAASSCQSASVHVGLVAGGYTFQTTKNSTYHRTMKLSGMVW